MEPIVTTRFFTKKRLQTLLTALLVIVLGVLVVGYIYFGMYLAKQNDSADDTLQPGHDTTQAPELTREQKMEILESLQNQSDANATTPTVEERQKTLESLSADTNDSATEMTEAQKLDILNSLSAPE